VPPVSAPTVSASTVSAPTVSAPTVSAPTVSAPPVSSPAAPTPSASTPSGGSTCGSKTVSRARTQAALAAQAKPTSLVDGTGKIFERARPSYEQYPASSFVSVKSSGAKGDGTTDDTQAIQNIFDNVQEGQIVYFDHGAYLITSTIKVPKNIKITGEV